MFMLGAITISQQLQSVHALLTGAVTEFGKIADDRKAPVAISGDSVYIVWFSNKTGNDEVFFRSSSNAGTTFDDKINLSNSTDAESQDVEIAAEGDSIVVSWWERNATSDEPAARISGDNGQTFGPTLKLAANGTIGGGGE